jgi:ATP/maltotriose-dependent transcriptional regulator MalT/DNA-binding SARP family transcriptional activator
MTRDGWSAFVGKVVPPPAAPHTIDRPRVAASLADAPWRQVTALTAGAGFGKTTVLAAWAADHHCAWYTVTAADRDPVTLARGLLASLALRVPGLDDALAPAIAGVRGPDAPAADLADAFVPALAAAVHGRVSTDVILVVDDLQELDGYEPALRLMSALCHTAPPRLHLVLASRTDLPFRAERLRLSGQLLLLGAGALQFDEAETATMLGAVGGVDAVPVAGMVQRLTGGWPAGVRLVAEALATAADREAVLADLVGRGGTVGLVDEMFAAEVLQNAPAELVQLLRVAAALDSFDAALLAELGVRDARALLRAAVRRGIHVAAAPAPEGWYVLTPMSRQYALARLATDPAELVRLRVAAAGWHAARGDTVTALRYLSLADDSAGIVALLERDGSALLAAGQGLAVLDALAKVPIAARTPELDLIEGEACQVRGDWERAITCLSRLVPEDGPANAAAAWRLGLIYHLRGEPARALPIYLRGYADPSGGLADRALAAAWGAAAAWLTGDAATCRDLAEKAGELAEAAKDDRALAATYTARAMLAALDGDRRSNDMHYLRALDHAQRAGDVLQIIRIRANRGSRFLEEGYFAEAVVELDTAIGLAELAGFASLRTLALLNRGDSARWLGRLEDAARDFQAALTELQRLGSRLASYALRGLAAVHMDQGNLSLARAAYEEALALAEPTGDLQGLVPALTGLALAVAPEDPDEADLLVARALAEGANLAHTHALLAAGWVALRREDRTTARRYATAASDAARARRDRAAVAESLELRAAAEEDVDAGRGLLMEAEALWKVLGSPLPLARTRLALARTGATGKSDTDLAEVERICRELGARTLAAQAATLRAELSHEGPAEVAIRTLGGFRVVHRGEPVPPSAWESRRARELLKILVARRGAPAGRRELGELLWPRTDPGRAAVRLSAAVSTLRSVLDPGRRYDTGRYVVSGAGALWLRPEYLDVDVETFLRRANAALVVGEPDQLSVAEAAYTGEFCAEDGDADWAQPLRVEARHAYVAVARALALHHAARGEHDAAARYLLRLLVNEPADERAHLTLVHELDAAGRHGDARQTYGAYTTRMAQLAAEPAPYPSFAHTSPA